MKIKEFSQKNGLFFFWATIVLAIVLVLVSTCFHSYGFRGNKRGNDDFANRRNSMMQGQRGGYKNFNQGDIQGGQGIPSGKVQGAGATKDIPATGPTPVTKTDTTKTN